MRIQRSTLDGLPFDAPAVRREALACRAWLAAELVRATGEWDATVAVTHFGPSFRSADPRFGGQPGTASFCNADDDLLPLASLWIHGHLHCRHDYRVRHPGGETRVVCNARGHARQGRGRRLRRAAHRRRLRRRPLSGPSGRSGGRCRSDTSSGSERSSQSGGAMLASSPKAVPMSA
jgi:hypothetical protein